MLDPHHLAQQIETQRQAAQVPGVAIAVVQGRQIIYAQGFGLTSVEDGGLPVTPQTLFRIASATKPLVGTAVMRLVQAGKLDLDYPVHRYIPWLKFSQSGAETSITLRQLMSHTAGLPFEYETHGSRDPDALAAYVREDIPRMAFVAPPGTVWHYSNPSINLAGYILEMVLAKPFSSAMDELLFIPLRMHRTTFDPTVAMTFPLAQSHDTDRDGQLCVQHQFGDRVAGYPSGGAMSTVLDLAHFAILHLSEGEFLEKQLLTSSSVREMQTAQASVDMATGRKYGLTFFLNPYKGIHLVEHWGGVDSFSSRFVLVPALRVGVIIFHNRMASAFDPDGIVDSILESFLP